MSERLLILGAGTGGTILANLLSRNYRVTVVDKSDIAVFQPGQLFVAFGGRPPEKYKKPLNELLDQNIEFIKGVVRNVDIDEREVILEDERRLSYDYLVIALGVDFDYDAIAGLRENFEKTGDYYSGLESAKKLFHELKKLKSGTLVISVADPVYKCVPAPHKGAALAAHYLKRIGSSAKVILTVPFTKVYPAEKLADEFMRVLNELGVEVRTMFTLDSIDTNSKKIYSLEGEELNYDLLTVIPPHRGPKIYVNPPEIVDKDGYFKVDKYKLNIEGYDDVFAIGDNAILPTAKSGVGAHLQAEVLADRFLGYESKFLGRTFCPCISNDLGSFVISDYEHPAVRVRCSRFKRLMEELFISGYWSFIKRPRTWRPFIEAIFEATKPSVLGVEGW